MDKKLTDFLNGKVKEYERPEFIGSDPICIPHQFTKQQDIEISGFFASIFAWGNRTTIINKSMQLMQLMDDAPHVGNDGHRRHIGAQHEDPRATALKRVHVDRPRRRFVEIPILRVADDADDLERSRLTFDRELVSNGLCVPK